MKNLKFRIFVKLRTYHLPPITIEMSSQYQQFSNIIECSLNISSQYVNREFGNSLVSKQAFQGQTVRPVPRQTQLKNAYTWQNWQ